MTTQRDMPALKAVLYQESYDWLLDNWPGLAGAIAAEVQRGARPEDIKRAINQTAGRERLAARAYQAAMWLASQKESQP
jgi:hypothetical protein